MAIQGLRDTSNFVADQRPKNFREGILLLYPNGKAPLTALTSLMKTREVDDPQFYWWDKALDDRRFALGATITSGQTSFTLAAGSNAKSLKEGDLLKSEQTSEVIRIAADPTSDTVLQSVQRGFAGTTPTAITYDGAGINPYWVVIGSAYEEGSLAPTGIAFDPNKRYNYTQIFRNTLEATRTAMKTRLRTGDAVKEAKRECLEYHSIDMERAFWFGVASESVHNGKPIRTLGGVISQIPTENKVAATAAGVDFDEFEGYMKRMFDYGGSEKMAFLGNTAALTIQQFVRKNTQYQFVQGQKEFGMNVSRLVSPFGEIVLKTHPLWNQMTGGTTGGSPYYGMDSTMIVLEMANLQYVHLKDSDTKYQPELQANDLDGLKSGYLSEVSMELHHPQTHFMVTQLARGIVDS